MNNKDNISDDNLSVAEAARFLRVSKPTFYRWLEAGRVRGSKVGKQWRFREADLRALIVVSDPASVRREAALEAAATMLRQAFKGSPGKGGEFMETLDVLNSAEEKAAGKVLSGILGAAVAREVSDLHFEPTAQDLRMRQRVSGTLLEMTRLPRESISPLARVIGKLSCSRTPEAPTRDGRLLFTLEGRTVDIRYNILPSVHGEAITMRLLDPKGVLRSLPQVGLDPQDAATLRDMAQRPGLVLATGPTSSGKTTLLYALLQETIRDGRKAITVEDPVEFLIEGTIQSQVRPSEGYTFPVAIRNMLRQDTQTLFCGEIRDPETAIALCQAAMTGHSCLSSLPAPTAAGAVQRLLEMEVGPLPVAEAVTAVIAVRLLPRLCRKCRKASSPDQKLGGVVPKRAFASPGCAHCHKTGIQGRALLYELLVPDKAFREQVLAKADGETLAKAAAAAGMTPLAARAMALVEAGEVSLASASRIC